ncbi:alpha-2-macroglobulin-like protein 1 isoform X2 [Dendropsophus ebraccatus]
MFVQTDRAIYQPGEKVIIKAVDFNENLIAKNDPFTEVTIEDDRRNIIKRWKNVQPNGGILELNYDLSPNIYLGLYKITVNKTDVLADVTVTVDKLVLPKFEVEIVAPEEVTIYQSSFSIDVCGKYTYGKSVRGHATGTICRKAIFSSDHLCKPIDGETDVNGCLSVAVDPDYFKFKYTEYDNYVDIEAFLREEGTGVERNNTALIYITDVLAKVAFKESRGFFKSGLDYQGLMTLTGPDGQPLEGEDIELYIDGGKREEIYTTDEKGMARFTLESTLFGKKVINLEARYLPKQPLADPTDPEEVIPVYEDGSASLFPSYTNTISQVKIRSEPFVLPCREKVNLWADYVLDPSEYTKDTINFYYLIIASGKIVSSSSVEHTISSDGDLRSFFAFPVTVTSAMSPEATIIIYAGLQNGDLIADSRTIPVTSCFPNIVSLEFSEEQSLPGSKVNLHISAYPNSLCNVRAVDKSAEILKSEEQHAEDTVNEFLRNWNVYGYPIAIEELQGCPDGSPPQPSEDPEETDTYNYFEGSGTKALTNFLIRKPLNCGPEPTILIPQSAVPESFEAFSGESVVQNFVAFAAGTSARLPPQEKVRKIFPATWLMNTVPIGPTGELNYSLTAPDTITQWNADAFCTSTIGLGFSPRTHLQVFTPYFLYVNLPYSIKQGETLVLKAIVLNFIGQCIKVNVTLYQTKDFQVEPCDGCTYSACLCSEPTSTFTWKIIPLTLGTINITIGTEALSTTDLCDGQKPIVPAEGRSDTVQRRLRVESNGVPVENTVSFLLCAFDSQTIPLNLPENVVLGSPSAEVTVTGDIMGKPLSNLNNLVKLPRGCGEQNMILLAPVVSALRYLGATGQLTDEIRDQAYGYLENGYQNQLNYKHKDGSYSVFGERDGSGSTWLTAFVARIFFQVWEQIEIDQSQITDPLNWLKGQQESNGCFKNVGQLYHKEIQGGLDSQISLTAYVTSAFLEVKLGEPTYDDVIKKAKQCLKNCTNQESSTYTKAQCAYTYTLLGDTETRRQLLEQLDEVAIKEGDKTHWSINSDLPKDDPLWSKPNSVDVEITSYVALAMISENEPTKTDLGAVVPTIRWLACQQNANGGYASTQDTVVAIAAVSRYSSLTFVDESMPTITISNDKGFNRDVTVNPQKLTEVQVVDLPDIPAEYTLEASGSGCAYVQLTERHNIQDPEPEGAFTLELKRTPINCPPHPLPSFTFDITVGITNGSDDSNMALVIIQYLSGYVATEDSIDKLLAIDVVKRVERSEMDITIYLDKVTSTPIKLSIEMEERNEVLELAPAIVLVKDYYQTTRRKEEIYVNPCA